MAYTAPTAAEIKTRFPAFASVADATIETLIEEAVSYVSEDWLERDYAVAYKYIVAHLLVREGVLDAAGALPTAHAPGAVQSESIGDSSVSYASQQGMSASDTDLASTEYGRRYLALRNKNFGSPVVV